MNWVWQRKTTDAARPNNKCSENSTRLELNHFKQDRSAGHYIITSTILSGKCHNIRCPQKWKFWLN